MISRSLYVLLLMVVTASVRAAPSLPLQDGEHLTYRISWAIVPGAGEIKIDAHRDTTAKELQLKVTTTTATRKIARFLLRFDARAESIFDLRTGKLISYHETSETSDKKTDHTLSFDYPNHKAFYAVPGDAEPRTLTIPEGNPVDLIMGLLQTRSWDLKPGETRDALVIFDDDFYELTIHAARTEQLTTSLGTFQTLVLEPRMEKTAPKGMFKRGSSVRIWIAQDSHRLPVRFQVEFKIGTGTATLEAYDPPTAAETSTGGEPKAPVAQSDAKDPVP